MLAWFKLNLASFGPLSTPEHCSLSVSSGITRSDIETNIYEDYGKGAPAAAIVAALSTLSCCLPLVSGLKIKAATAEQKFSKVVEALLRDGRITQGGGKGFGSGALKVNGKIFAMLDSENQFVVKMPKHRVDELVASGTGSRFEPRRGKPMKEWLVVIAARADWVRLAKEACEFVSRGKS